jgi:phage tail-like protein
VTLGDEGPERPQAGFQEVSGIGLEVNVAEYRAGNSLENSPIKVTGTYKVPDVTLKRGLMGFLDLYRWLDEVRNGSQEQLRTVKIDLMSEDRATVAMSWKLVKARPIKYTGPSLNGKGTDVAVEELVLAAERIELS